MNRRKSLVILISAASLALAAGCRPKKKPAAPPQTVESPTMEMDQRMSALQRQAQGLSSVVRQLPGRDANHDRQLVAQAFDATSESLTMMAGQEPDGALGQQIVIVDRVRAFLHRGDPKVSIEPSVDAGLRATYSALEGVRQNLFPHDQRVAQQVNAFGGKLPELDQVRGPMHSVVTAEVFQSAADAIGTMSNILNAREQQIAQPAMPAHPTYPAQPAPAPYPAPAPAPAPAAAAAPVAPAQPQVPAAAPAPVPAAAAPGGPTAEEYQRLQRDYQQLQQQLQQQQQILQQLQQQQQMQQQMLQRSAPPPPPPAPAAVPAPAPAPANQNK